MKTKRYLTQEEVQQLFDGKVEISEKVDGKQDVRLYSYTSHPFVIGGENMKFVHSIFYNKLPSWYLVWDIWSPKTKMFAAPEMRSAMCRLIAATEVSVLFYGTITLQEAVDRYLTRTSTFGDELAEGIVIKNYGKQKMGKIVRKEFVAGLELGHWTRRKGLKRQNELSH